MKRILIILAVLFSFTAQSQKVGNFRQQYSGDTYFQNYSEYLVRASLDSGVIESMPNTFKILKGLKAIGVIDSVKFLWTGEMGAKERVSGVNHYATKLYSGDTASNDAVQTTELNQPFLSGNIAPNEKLCLNNPNGGVGYVTHPEISFSATDSWSVTTIFNVNSYGSGLFSNTLNYNYSVIYSDGLLYVYLFEDVFAIPSVIKLLGKNAILTITYDGINKVNAYINNTLVYVYTYVGNFNFSIIGKGLLSRNYFNGKYYSHIIHAQALTQQQVTAEYNLLRSIYPEIESVVIGKQEWTTSNCDMVCTPMGNVIPNVTDNTAWAALTTPAWCYYNNDPTLGSIYGKLYNWYAVKLIQDDIDAYNTANPNNHWGWHVPSSTEFNTLATTLGGASVAGGKMKVAGTDYWNSPNTGADNSSGFSMIGGGFRPTSFASIIQGGFFTTNDEVSSTLMWIIYAGNSGGSLAFDNSNIKTRGCSLRFIKD